MGMPMGPPRAPRLPLPEAQRPALRKVLHDMGVLPAEKTRARAWPARHGRNIDLTIYCDYCKLYPGDPDPGRTRAPEARGDIGDAGYVPDGWWRGTASWGQWIGKSSGASQPPGQLPKVTVRFPSD